MSANFQDKLSQTERLRLEAFAQAVMVTNLTHNPTQLSPRPLLQTVLDNAKRISLWLSDGQTRETN